MRALAEDGPPWATRRIGRLMRKLGNAATRRISDRARKMWPHQRFWTDRLVYGIKH